MTKFSRLRFVFAILAIGGLAGCAGDSDKDKYQDMPVEDLYNNALNRLKERDYAIAAKAFDEVERQHPYSVWATRAQLMSAYSYYLNSKYEESIQGLDRFIQLHPSHKDTAYAYYLKALCYYEQIADVGRDQKITDQALRYLQEVVDRFPNSPYARDARMKVDLTRDHLAGKEMVIGRYYERKNQFGAAINRYRAVIDNYQTTTHVPEALHRLIECYQALGLTDEAEKIASVMGYNYPGSEWYQDSYTLVTGEKAPPPYGEDGESGWLSGLW